MTVPGPERPVGRIRFMDQQRVNLDGFAVEDPDLGLVALRSPHDPEPGLVISEGRVTEMDGVAEEDFDSLDAYIARHGLDLSVAAEVMALPDTELARRAVSPDVPRAEVIRLCAGATPAKLARVLALLRPAELGLAMTKLRGRRTPSNQAHVTNRLDDPLLLAADSATAAAFGFREIETTVPVLADAPSNAVACLIGAAVGSQGVLIQCSVEEALELELGMRGLTSYAETVSLYGTEPVFTDGDDTPWSKAFLTSAYASRGMKMRVSSGAGAEVLMAGAERKSMLYLEARCIALARAIGAQGVQNGGIDGASVAASVPGGLRELMAENVMRPNEPWPLPGLGYPGITCRRLPSSTSISRCYPWSPTRTITAVPVPATSPRPNGSGRSTRSARRAGFPTCGRRRRVSRCPCSLR